MICEHEKVKPVSLIISPKGERIIDFGQNLAGYVEFTVTANAGEEIEFSCAEVLDKEGNFYHENYRSALDAPAGSYTGYGKTAYSLLLQEKNPSWLYEVNHGAITIWEHWDRKHSGRNVWALFILSNKTH